MNSCYEIDEETGFLHQKDSFVFQYNKDYLEKQSTNDEMARLRINQINACLGEDFLSKSNVIELGPGKGVLFEHLSKICKKINGYDVVDSPFSTLTKQQAKDQLFDVLFACDVIEHFQDIREIFDYNFKYAYISSPILPDVDFFDITNWRHFKPNEHLWYFNESSLIKWFNKNNFSVLLCNNNEDTIRTKWSANHANIISLVIRNNKYAVL